MSKTIDGKMNDIEMIDRLPEVQLIDDRDLREKTLDALCRTVPDYFWKVPASSSGKYHNPFCRGEHGLWIHVKMCVTAFQRQVRSELKMGRISQYDADCAIAAILLHDVLKYGHTYEEGEHTVNNHAELAATWVEHNTDLPIDVSDAILCHSGPKEWGGTEPDTVMEHMVHDADMTASDPNCTLGVYDPHDDIHRRYPNLPRADL